MAVPTHKKGKTVLLSTDQCPRCPHLMSAHDDSPLRCTGTTPSYQSLPTGSGRCACTPQDVHGDPRSF